MSESVLIIDDSPSIHRLIGVHLQPDGMTLHSAFDGENGLIMAASLLPGSILLDIDMPGMDGLDVYRHLKADTKTAEIPVLFITASSVLDHRFNGLQLGVLDYVSKPFKATELRAKVAAIFQIQNQLDGACLQFRERCIAGFLLQISQLTSQSTSPISPTNCLHFTYFDVSVIRETYKSKVLQIA